MSANRRLTNWESAKSSFTLPTSFLPPSWPTQLWEIAAPFWGVISMESAPQTVTVLSNRVAFCLNSHRVLRAGVAQTIRAARDLSAAGKALQVLGRAQNWDFSCKKAVGVMLIFSLSAHSPSGRHGKRKFVSPSDSYAEILTLWDQVLGGGPSGGH